MFDFIDTEIAEDGICVLQAEVGEHQWLDRRGSAFNWFRRARGRLRFPRPRARSHSELRDAVVSYIEEESPTMPYIDEAAVESALGPLDFFTRPTILPEEQ